MSNFLVSLVIPVFNEEHNIKPLLHRLLPIVQAYDYEVIFVSDGSKDGTVKVVKEAALNNPKIKLISFSRNFGHQMALTAGYDHSKGDCIISLDADLQDPPEIIPKMIEEWQKGAKVVYAKRGNRDVDSYFKQETAKLFYEFINFMSDTPIPENVGDFRLLDRQVVKMLNDLPEHSRFLRGLVAWGGFPASSVTFDREKRNSGKTHYTLSKMFNFALDGITSFSTKPLRMVTYFGFATSAFSILAVLFKFVQHFMFGFGDWLPGWASLFFSIVFLGGVQLITIGLIGEYIGKIYKEVQQRPRYIIGEKINV